MFAVETPSAMLLVSDISSVSAPMPDVDSETLVTALAEAARAKRETTGVKRILETGLEFCV